MVAFEDHRNWLVVAGPVEKMESASWNGCVLQYRFSFIPADFWAA